MTPPPAPPVLLRHGTTRYRAERLTRTPPDPNYIDPGGNYSSRAGGISFVMAGARNIGLGTVEMYARAKAANFPNEGEPVILEVEVPAEVVDILRNDPFAGMVVDTHEIRFEPGLGFEELCQVWLSCPKRIVPV